MQAVTHSRGSSRKSDLKMRIVIHGFGRIGRVILRQIWHSACARGYRRCRGQ